MGAARRYGAMSRGEQAGMEYVEISLTQGKVALIDAEDWPLVANCHWYASRAKGHYDSWYAANKTPAGIVLMHRRILGTILFVDHRNGDGLDNRKANLRIATLAENNRNKRPNGGRRFKGFYWDKQLRKFRVQITLNHSKKIHIGLFNDEIDAARAYDNAASKYYGSFARLNLPEVGVP